MEYKDVFKKTLENAENKDYLESLLNSINESKKINGLLTYYITNKRNDDYSEYGDIVFSRVCTLEDFKNYVVFTEVGTYGSITVKLNPTKRIKHNSTVLEFKEGDEAWFEIDRLYLTRRQSENWDKLKGTLIDIKRGKYTDSLGNLEFELFPI